MAVGRRHGLIDTDLGELTLTADEVGLTGLYFPAHRYPPPPEQMGGIVEAADDQLMATVAQELSEYLTGKRTDFSVPLSTAGDRFSETVWQLLREIPYGETTTYGELALRLGNAALAQRVGQAVGHNPVSIIVPCHRVLGAGGSLTGFAGGLDRKRQLLDLEGAGEPRLF